jgi:hypothetical protein
VQVGLLDAKGNSGLQTITNGEPLAHLKALKQFPGLNGSVLDAGGSARRNLIDKIFQ